MNKIKLTDHQQPVFDSIWDFIQKDEEHLALLAGCAGSGKSTLTIEIIKKVLSDAIFNNVAVCATTQKAVRVIKKMLPVDERSKVTFSTVHSLLGLKHKITNNGKEVFERDKNSPSKFALYDVVIIDEASMLSDELFHELEDQNYRGVKIIFVGDPNQINPVNHDHAIPMLPDKRDQYKIKKFELTEIVRQAKGNPIIETSQKILHNEFKFELGKKQLVDGKGWAMLNRHQPEVINELLKYYFCSSEFDRDANYCKLICWRNVMVDQFNKLIRGMKYGVNAPKIVAGEKLIVDRPIKGETKDEILFNTNEDLEVLKLEIKTKKLYEQDFKYYDALVASEEETANIHILHESSQKNYDKCLKVLAEDAKNEKDAFRRGQKWGKYFDFQENFAQTNYNCAITTHKCISKDMRVIIKNKGIIPIKEIEVGDYIKDSKGYNKVLNKWASGKKIEHELITRCGFKIKSSENHKFLCVDNENFIWKELKDIRQNDIVCIDRRVNDHCSEKDVISHNMAWFLGLLVGDGCYSGNGKKNFNRIELTVFGEDNEVESTLKALEQEYERFNIKINRYKSSTKYRGRLSNIYRLVIDNKQFREYCVTELGLERDKIKEHKRVPNVIWKSSLEIQRNFIKGFVDSDGSIGKNNNVVRIVNKSWFMLEEVQLLLLQNGIVSDIRFANNPKYKVLNITGPSAQVYVKNIGFGLNRKNKRIKTDYDKYGKTNVDFIPFKSTIKKHVLNDFGNLCGKVSIYHDIPDRNMCGIFRSTGGFSYHHLNLFVEKYNQHNETYKKQIEIPEIIKFLQNNSIYFDRVTSVVNTGIPQDMYDIEVEDSHEFICNGFVTHNCQGSTYNNTFVVYTDICLNHNKDEMKRILYTGVTRPKEMLYIL